MTKLISAVLFLLAMNVLSQDWSGTYEFKGTGGSTGTLTVSRISGSKYSFSMYAWWNIASGRQGSLDGQITAGSDGIGIYYGDYGCSMTTEFLGLGANVTFGGCGSFNIPEDFNGYYLKTSSNMYRNFEVIAGRSYFYTDNGTKRDAYVVAGDVVMVTELRGDWAYAVYTNSSGTTTEGWLLIETLNEIR